MLIMRIITLMMLVVLSIIFGSIDIKFREMYEEYNGPVALAKSSQFVGNDNLDTEIDPKQATCMYYLKEKRGWGGGFAGDDEKSTNRRYALSGLMAARGLVAGGFKDTPIPWFDACVIPKELLKTYNINNNCELKTVNGTTNFDKALGSMVQQGCMIDFSGKLGGSKQAVSEDRFNVMLDEIYNGMKYLEQDKIKKMEDEVKDRDGRIKNLDATIAEKDKDIKTLEGDLSTTKIDLLVAKGEKPSYKYTPSMDTWIAPVADKEIATVRELRLITASSMAITFRLFINGKSRHWRNILHITRKQYYGVYQKAYDADEDRYARPSIYVPARSYGLQIRVNTTATNVQNPWEFFNIPHVPSWSAVALVFNGRALTVYIDNVHIYTTAYKGDILTPDATAKVFLSNRFANPANSVLIKNLQFFSTAFSRETYLWMLSRGYI